MASRKNRKRNANRKSPKSGAGRWGRFSQVFSARWAALQAWIASHRLHAIVIGFAALFFGGLLGGYWIASWLERAEEPPFKYASIDDLISKLDYTEVTPGQPRVTLEEKAPVKPPPAPPRVEVAAAQQPTWRRNALPFRDLRRPLVAIVIDDVGVDRPRSKRAWELPGPLTMSFLPYAKDLREQARAARARGHELMLHLPMEPSGRNDPGPGALLVSLSEGELKRRVTAALDSFDGYVGVNNHMGSRFTTQRTGMQPVLAQFKARGLMFLDSRTSAQTVGDQIAQEIGLPSITRHVFLDDDDNVASVRAKLAEVERLAKSQGFVVAIGHPHESTLQALGEWLPRAAERGITLAPASAILRKRNGWD
jgi:polysaccharide deacetylase 2 family uncharacterized protein YibQ